ncbi:MAG: hypothetical protein ACFWT1_04970 [Selenomonas sp.]|jgi:hypothetical protein
MNNEATKQGAARAVPVSTLSTYVAAPAAPAAPAYATAASAAAVASARMPAAFAPAYASVATADALSAAPAAATAAPALAAIPGDDLAPDGAITAILPIYDDNGRGIVIYTADGGRRVTGRRMRSILQRLAERNCRTIPLIRRRMKDLLGGRQELPLPISPQLILVPCKVVTPRVKGDETIGYFSLAHIRALHTLPHRSRGHAAAAVRSGRKAPGDRAAAPVATRHVAAPAAARRAAEPSAARRAANPPVARAAAEKRRPPTAAKCPDASCFVSAARRAAELPVYELSDGRRVALLCTSDTARHRLEMAAYARCLMFGA